MRFSKQKFIFFAVAFAFVSVLVASPSVVWGHPGRTASDGCHYCRTNCDSWGVPWNERHCHGGGSVPSSSYTPPPSVSEPSTPSVSSEPAQTSTSQNEADFAFSVVKVVDGDTISISYFNGETKKVRLIGIDTPETVDPRKPVQCFGLEASAKTKALLEGQQVKLVKDSVGDTVDKYGRLLRYVYRYPDNLFVNAELVKQGYAYAYLTYPFSKSAEFKQYENSARQNLVGLWSPDACGEKAETVSQPVETKKAPESAPVEIQMPEQKTEPQTEAQNVGFFRRVTNFLFGWLWR